MRNTIPDTAGRLLFATGLALGLTMVQGCAKKAPPNGPDTVGGVPPASASEVSEPSSSSVSQDSPEDEQAPGRAGRQVGPRISTYYLSAGDEIRISVAGHDELQRTIRIPPDGHIFYPVAGDIGVDGMSIPELREVIAERLRTAEEQRIESGDQVRVRVYRQEDLTITTTVPNSGRVNLPLAGEVEIVGLTVEGASRAIAERLVRYVVSPSVSTTIERSASGLPGRVTDPHVSIEVISFGGHKVVVLGEVRVPGVYVSGGGSRLLEMVALAGGPTDDAKMNNVALIRPATEASQGLAVALDLNLAIEGDLSQNPPVQRGDVIYVPRSTFASLAQFFDYVYRIVRPFAIFANPNRLSF